MIMPKDNQEKITANWMKEAQKGYIRIGVLILLNKKPAHGYELMKEIKDRTQGFWSPTPGGVYPVLARLEKDRYIKGEWSLQRNRKIKTYRITQLGKVILKKALVKQSEIADNINSLFKDFSVDVLKIEPDSLAMLKLPLPFSAFLEDEKGKIDVNTLEEQRNHIIHSIQMMQENLQEINRMIAEERKKSKQP
jgi:DNA-binding PadR family transcriptional regulator